jgi:STE24 endopeptidase
VTRPVPQRVSSERRVAAVVALLGAVAFVALAVAFVPWNPVPGGGPTSMPAPETVLPPAQLARAEAYAGPARIVGWCSLAVSMAVVCWLGFTSAGLRLVGRLRGWWWVRVLLGVALVSLVGRLATLPFSVVSYRRRVSYGLSTQAWPDWLRDVGVSWAVNVVGTSIVLLVVVGTARRWRTWWPAVAAALAAVIVMLGSFVYPLLVEPLFNHFEPLHDGPLRAGVLHLAKAEGVHVEDVLEADASRRTTTLNAYVSGFGSTRRVVLYDNLVRGVPREEALSVVAHELSHASHDDVLHGSLLGAAGAVMGIGLLGLLLGRRGWRGSVEEEPGEEPDMQKTAGDPAVVPRVLALVAVAGLLASPVQNGISRKIETRADVDAVVVTGDPEAFIDLQRQLATRSLADLTSPAWSQFWFGSHPTPRERIAVAGWLSDRTVRP